MSLDTYDASHPSRRKAIRIMETITELLGKPKLFDGEIWYTIEDCIITIIEDKWSRG